VIQITEISLLKSTIARKKVILNESYMKQHVEKSSGKREERLTRSQSQAGKYTCIRAERASTIFYMAFFPELF